jgi:2,4-dienoyl-CoA reductase (NADPH2)
VLVVGGGPAGLEAARVAATRGHRVTLCEAGSELGGALRTSGAVNEPNARLVEWLDLQVRSLGVEVRLGSRLTEDEIVGFGADVVIVAVGAAKPKGDPASAVWGVEDLQGEGRLREPGDTVVVVGGGGVGLSLADHWSEHGRTVIVLEASAHFGADLSPPRRWRVLADLRERGVELVRNAALEVPGEGCVRLVVEGQAREVPYDTVLLAGDWESDSSLAVALEARGVEVHAAGDCRRLGLVEGAMKDAGRIARLL